MLGCGARIGERATGPDALVLDPFAGSGTTAQAVLEQNASDGGHRRFVLIETNDRAQTLIFRRLAEVPGSPPAYDFYTLVPDRCAGLMSSESYERTFARHGSKRRSPQEAASFDPNSKPRFRALLSEDGAKRLE